VLHPSVVNIGGIWYMYYSAKTTGGFSNVGLATSSDFVTWSKHGTSPIISDSGIALPSVIKIGSLYYMYVQTIAQNVTTIDYYTSSDGISWTFGGIALRYSTADWYYGLLVTDGVEDPYVFQNKHGWYEMVYTADMSPGTQKLGYAVSADGITWYTYQAGPILGSSGTAYPGNGALFEDASTFYLMYTNVLVNQTSYTGNAATMPDH
jgi:predicted GH43/DUF377 family glycosyl hydrolase